MKRVLLVLTVLILHTINLSAEVAPDRAQLHWVNSGMNERDLTIHPGGNLLLFSVTAPGNQKGVIMLSRKILETWQAPEVAPFSGQFNDIEPMFDPSGRHLYFASTRPRPDRQGNDWDLWRVALDNAGFGEPKNLGEPINSAGDEFYPSVTSNGDIYFTSAREGGSGREDIWRAIPNGDSHIVSPLGGGVNSAVDEYNAFVAPDSRYLIFGSYGRKDGPGGGDLYISYRNQAGAFESAILLPAPFNSSALDYCPAVYGDTFYFTSRRQLSIKPVTDYAETEARFNAPGNGLGDIWFAPSHWLPEP